MNLEFEISVQVKWMLIGLGIMILSIIVGEVVGWDEEIKPNVLGFIAAMHCVLGGIIFVIGLFATLIKDFENYG